MPARRRGQEPQRRARREARAQEAAARLRVLRTDEDQVWAEHQAWERERRRPRTLEEIEWEAEQLRQKIEARERMWAEVLRARDAVMADFARWEAERKQRSQGSGQNTWRERRIDP